MTASDEDPGADDAGPATGGEEGGEAGQGSPEPGAEGGGDTAREGGGPPEDPSTDGDVAETAGELAAALEDLQSELRPERRRGPLGLPAPPRPGEMLRFADEYAIPFAIAVLEANVRALKLLRGAIRLVDAGEETGERARSARDRAREVSRASLDRLDDALADLETAMAGEELPQNETAREVLTEARRLRGRLADELAASVDDDATDEPSDAPNGQASDPSADEGVPVDVESELQSIKDELGRASADGERSGSESDVNPVEGTDGERQDSPEGSDASHDEEGDSDESTP